MWWSVFDGTHCMQVVARRCGGVSVARPLDEFSPSVGSAKLPCDSSVRAAQASSFCPAAFRMASYQPAPGRF